MSTLNNATISDYLGELERAHEDLAAAFRRCSARELRIPPAPGEWSCADVALHIPVTYRFWMLWSARIRVLLDALELVDTTPVEKKTQYPFNHPDPTGVTVPELQRCLAELRQVTGELIDTLGWIRQDTWETQLPAISEEKRAELAETPPGHTINLSLPTAEQEQMLPKFLEYAGGFSVKGACGQILEGHTRNHTRQFIAALEAAKAEV